MIHGIKGTPRKGRKASNLIANTPTQLTKPKYAEPSHREGRKASNLIANTPTQPTKPEYVELSHREVLLNTSTTISSIPSISSTSIVICDFPSSIPYKLD